jgi:F-type H+-transporting ATPase subunit epsilon
MPLALMQFKLLLPSLTFVEKSDVLRIVAETEAGAFGLLPQRLDCAAALTPGILTYETEADGEVFVAVDEGVLVKVGSAVTVSVRRALAGDDLAQLHSLVIEEFLTLNESEAAGRALKLKLETGFLKRFASFQHE